MNHPPILGVLCLASGSLLAGVPEAHGGFDGHTVTAEWLFPNFVTVIESHDVIVGDGVELPSSVIINDGKSDFLDIDIGVDFVLFVFNTTTILWLDVAFNGWRFSDTDGTIPEIVGYVIDSVSNGISGLDNSDLFFDADSVWGNFRGVTVAGPSDFIRLNVQFAESSCPWDLNGDGVVNVLDLIVLLMTFGPCEDCPADLDDDGFVNVLDLIALITNFGPCPGTPCVWDVNGDGVVDQSDVQAVTSNLGPCDGCPEDINGDGVVNGQDAAAVATHFGPCP